MKKYLLIILMVVVAVSACDLLGINGDDSDDNGTDQHGEETGSLLIRFTLDSQRARAITFDFTQVASGDVFLIQGGEETHSAGLTIDTGAQTGEATISQIELGDYDIVVELYDSSSTVLYSGTDMVTIAAGDNGTKTLQLTSHSARLTVTGSWSEDIPGIDQGYIELWQDSSVEYARYLILDTANKEITGAVDRIYPDDYEVYIAIVDNSDAVLFDGVLYGTLSIGDNTAAVSLSMKTGLIAIQLGEDVTAPAITSGPSASVTGQDVTITWETDEEATSTVCFSTTSGFNYATTLSYKPADADLTADTTSHSITITEMGDNTYYYVAVSCDAAGNMAVSDEGIFEVTTSLAGTEKWCFATGAYVYVESSPAIGADGTVYIGSSDDNVYALDPIDGSEKWAFTSGHDVWSSLAIGADGTVYVGSYDWKVYALDPVDGTEIWSFGTSNQIRSSSPAIGADGTLYIGSYDGKVYAIYSDSGGLADSPWPMFGQNPQHTGRQPVPEYAIGNIGPAGGLIFYDDEADGIDDIAGARYLEAAPVSTEWSDKYWGGYETEVGVSAQGTVVGTGGANTEAIVTAYGDSEPYNSLSDYAAKLCWDLDHNGYTDWFLPSKDELNLMFENLRQAGLGSFTDGAYWCSSENNAWHVWAQYFNDYGAQYNNFAKNSYMNIRAIRAF